MNFGRLVLGWSSPRSSCLGSATCSCTHCTEAACSLQAKAILRPDPRRFNSTFVILGGVAMPFRERDGHLVCNAPWYCLATLCSQTFTCWHFISYVQVLPLATATGIRNGGGNRTRPVKVVKKESRLRRGLFAPTMGQSVCTSQSAPAPGVLNTSRPMTRTVSRSSSQGISTEHLSPK
jgi:hypothetical protein